MRDAEAGALGQMARPLAMRGMPTSRPPPRDRPPPPPPAPARPRAAPWPGSAPEASSALEEPLALVAGHRLVEELLLGARVVEVVVDDVVAERRSRDLAVLKLADRLVERVRKAFDVGLVCIAGECGW